MAVPSPELMFRVAGMTDANAFLVNGMENVEDYEAALGSIGKRLSDYDSILDFGCGCGRLLRWLIGRAKGQISATDIDRPAVEWVKANLGVDAKINDGLPPTTFADASFDLIIGHSIFTHLNEKYQDAWLAELARISKPGGHLLLTFHGAFNWDFAKKQIVALAALDQTLTSKGFLYWDGDGWERHFPSFYHSSWHRPEYIRKHWSRWFEIVDIRERGARPTQDMAILRRPP